MKLLLWRILAAALTLAILFTIYIIAVLLNPGPWMEGAATGP